MRRRMKWIRRNQRLVEALPAPALPREWVSGETHRAADAREAAAVAAGLVGPGDVVLVKASRGIGLETVAEAVAGAGSRG